MACGAWKFNCYTVNAQDSHHAQCLVGFAFLMLLTAIWNILSVDASAHETEELGRNQILSWFLLSKWIT